MNGLPGGARAVVGDASVISGHQHGPLRQGNEDRVVYSQLHQQFNIALGRIEARSTDFAFQPSDDFVPLLDVEAGDLEIRGQRHLQYIGLFARRPYRLRAWTAERHHARVEIVSHGRLRIGGLEQFSIDPRNAPHVGKRRHVHDRHARHPRFRGSHRPLIVVAALSEALQRSRLRRKPTKAELMLLPLLNQKLFLVHVSPRIVVRIYLAKAALSGSNRGSFDDESSPTHEKSRTW